MTHEHPFFLAGRWERSPEVLPVTNPWDGALVGTTSLADGAQVETATSAAVAAAVAVAQQVASGLDGRRK